MQKQQKQEKNSGETYTIDVVQILKSLWKRAWLIVLCGLLTATIGFLIAAFSITPTYSSYIKLYVNSKSISVGGTSFSITSSELNAAQKLLKTYGEILKSRSTLERVVEKAELDYSWKRLSGMISYESSNETEIMRVTVVSGDPYEACKIANTIAEVLPTRISEIIDGASMEVVDSAVPDLAKIAPNVTSYTIKWLFLGVFASAVILAVLALMDRTIHDEEYLLNKYDYPILGKIPDLLNSGSKSYGYYYQKHRKSGN